MLNMIVFGISKQIFGKIMHVLVESVWFPNLGQVFRTRQGSIRLLCFLLTCVMDQDVLHLTATYTYVFFFTQTWNVFRNLKKKVFVGTCESLWLLFWSKLEEFMFWRNLYVFYFWQRSCTFKSNSVYGQAKLCH